MHAPVGNDEPSEDESVSEEDSFDPLAQAAEETAAKVRKRAGLPELVADALPSTVAMKMMILFLNLSKFSRIENKTLSMLISFAHWFATFPRTCLAKRTKKLQDGLDKFEEAASLTNLQEMTLIWFSWELGDLKQ